MGSSSCLITMIIVAVLVVTVANGQLTANFYSSSCPSLASIVRTGMQQAIQTEARMAASILRLHFHDCFAGGCDGSILLDDTATLTGEKTARPNANSARGFEVIDAIKTSVEAACNATVSCADILALAAKEGVNQLGGPTWAVPLGRRDSRTAFLTEANSQIPGPFENLTTLIPKFTNKGLSARDMTALSGGHSIGQARCLLFRARIYNETNVNPSFATTRRANCPATAGNGDNNLAPLDSTPVKFDNAYFVDLINNRGLLHSDQVLFNGGSQDALTRSYSNNNAAFNTDFVAAMIRMGNINPLTGTNGEIRRNCRALN